MSFLRPFARTALRSFPRSTATAVAAPSVARASLVASQRAFSLTPLRPASMRDEEIDVEEDFDEVWEQSMAARMPPRMPGRVHVQMPAPDFNATAVTEGQFSEVSLEDFAGKWLVLLFYPMDFTFVCPTEILSFDRALAQFREINTEVLAVSTDSEYSHLAWANLPRKEGGLGPDLKIPLVADKNHNISQDYGVLIPESGIALRGLFIIDPNGITRQITINDLPVGRSVEETIRLVKAFQFTDKHGEVCPASWSPENSDTIKANPKDALEYFGSRDKESK